MCQKCADLAEKYLPDLTEQERGNVLMNHTAFPFCSPEHLEVQLKEFNSSRASTESEVSE